MRYSDLAARIGWSRQRLNKLLNTDRNITVDELLTLAMALSVPPVALLTPPDEGATLSVEASPNMTVVLDRSEALGWLSGVPHDARLEWYVPDAERYFEEVGHTKVHRWHAVRWMALVEHVRSQELDDDEAATMPALGED